MILNLRSSFCCSATWFYIYRWLWDHSLLSYSDIINKHISSSCINRDLTFHDRTTKMENFSRCSQLLLSVIYSRYIFNTSFFSCCLPNKPFPIVTGTQLLLEVTIIFLVFEKKSKLTDKCICYFLIFCVQLTTTILSDKNCLLPSAH